MQGKSEVRPIGQVIKMADCQPQTLAERWRRSSVKLPTPGQAVGLLTTCLALVRPAGLSDENAGDWLRIAAGELCYIPLDIMDEACRHARRTCDHHSKIVPAIIAYADPVIEERRLHLRRQDEFARDMRPNAPAPERWRPEPGELDRIKEEIAAKIAADRPTSGT